MEIAMMIGIGITLGLAFILNVLTFKSFAGFMLWTLPILAFFVYAGVFDVWILYVFIVLDVFIIYYEGVNKR